MGFGWRGPARGGWLATARVVRRLCASHRRGLPVYLCRPGRVGLLGVLAPCRGSGCLGKAPLWLHRVSPDVCGGRRPLAGSEPVLLVRRLVVGGRGSRVGLLGLAAAAVVAWTCWPCLVHVGVSVVAVQTLGSSYLAHLPQKLPRSLQKQAGTPSSLRASKQRGFGSRCKSEYDEQCQKM